MNTTNTWVCQNCSFDDNRAEICSLRYGPRPCPEKEDEGTVAWACEQCTFSNVISSDTCDICGAARPGPINKEQHEQKPRTGTLWCPCDCEDGIRKEMKKNGECNCDCTCPDGAVEKLTKQGCPCKCKCNNCSESKRGPNGKCVCVKKNSKGCSCTVGSQNCPPPPTPPSSRSSGSRGGGDTLKKEEARSRIFFYLNSC